MIGYPNFTICLISLILIVIHFNLWSLLELQWFDSSPGTSLSAALKKMILPTHCNQKLPKLRPERLPNQSPGWGEGTRFVSCFQYVLILKMYYPSKLRGTQWLHQIQAVMYLPMFGGFILFWILIVLLVKYWWDPNFGHWNPWSIAYDIFICFWLYV